MNFGDFGHLTTFWIFTHIKTTLIISDLLLTTGLVHAIITYPQESPINFRFSRLGQAKLIYSLSSPPAWNSKNLAIISFFIIYHVLFIICHLQNNILCIDLANAV